MFPNNTYNNLKAFYRDKRKTVLCKNWIQSNHCDWGDSCAFAHGMDEMRSVRSGVPSECIKTRVCRNYINGRVCPFLDRCTFIHPVWVNRHVSPQNIQEVFRFHPAFASALSQMTLMPSNYNNGGYCQYGRAGFDQPPIGANFGSSSAHGPFNHAVSEMPTGNTTTGLMTHPVNSSDDNNRFLLEESNLTSGVSEDSFYQQSENLHRSTFGAFEEYAIAHASDYASSCSSPDEEFKEPPTSFMVQQINSTPSTSAATNTTLQDEADMEKMSEDVLKYLDL